MISVVLIGAGKVAKHLFLALNNSPQITVKQWYNRDILKIKSFKNKVQITDEIGSITEADIYIISIADDAISKVSSQLRICDGLIVHTSGSVNIHDLDKKNRRGVLYPLQTFSDSQLIDFKEVPLCLEALEKKDFKLLKNLAKSLGCKHYKVNTEQRQTLHLSAVFVNNFVNQMYRIGHEISDAKNINFDILKPLIMATAKKISEMSPYRAQTGPALRNDKKTIKKHLIMLENNSHKQIYEMMTKSIKKTHGR